MKPKQEICLILDNIRSRENVGSIFRTADATGVSKIYLCGITPLPSQLLPGKSWEGKPTSDKIAKTALGAEKIVSWEYHAQTWRLLKKLRDNRLWLIALEQSPQAVDYRLFKPKFPLAMIVGNEVRGLNKKILSFADRIVEIPMCGKKESLNVAVATGITLYKIKEQLE